MHLGRHMQAGTTVVGAPGVLASSHCDHSLFLPVWLVGVLVGKGCWGGDWIREKLFAWDGR